MQIKYIYILSIYQTEFPKWLKFHWSWKSLPQVGRCNQCNPKCNYKNKTNFSFCHPEFISGSIQNSSNTPY